MPRKAATAADRTATFECMEILHSSRSPLCSFGGMRRVWSVWHFEIMFESLLSLCTHKVSDSGTNVAALVAGEMCSRIITSTAMAEMQHLSLKYCANAVESWISSTCKAHDWFFHVRDARRLLQSQHQWRGLPAVLSGAGAFQLTSSKHQSMTAVVVWVYGSFGWCVAISKSL